MSDGKGALRLVLDDLPQEAHMISVLVLALATDFCAEPETFPVFRSYVASKVAGSPLAEHMITLTPGVVGGFGDLLRAGVGAL